MCGIAGHLRVTGDAPIDPEQLRRAMNAVAHRGPDDCGIHVSSDGRCGLAHRRLSIIDLASGQQPLSNEDGSVWITFNGEIYNFLELRPELEKQGHVFRTHSDTEVLVHLWEE